MIAVSSRLANLWNRRSVGLLALAASLLLAGALAVGVGVQIATDGKDHNGSESLFAHPQKSLLEVLQGRSPGPRTVAELTKNKRPAAAIVPHERALAKVQHPPLPNEFIQALVPTPPAVVTGPSGPLLASATPPVVLPQLAQSSGPPIVTPLIPGGGSPLVQDTPGPPGPPAPPSTPPLPEPGTWAMLLLGFALLGWKVRQHSARWPQLQPE